MVLLSRGTTNRDQRRVIHMARPFYPHEAEDPDLEWLVSNFLYERPEFLPVEAPALPLVLLPYTEVPEERATAEEMLPCKEK